MAERIVLCFYSRSITLRSPERANHLQTARTLRKRVEARGGRLFAWGARSIGFEFDFESIESTIDVAVQEVFGAGTEPTFSVGIASGELEPLDELAIAGMMWGPPIVRALGLGQIARPGEVLVDPSFDAVLSGELLTTGSRLGMLGDDRLRGLRLDLQNPWRARVAQGIGNLQVPLLVGRPDLIEMLVPSGCLGVVKAGRGAGGTRFLGELARSLEPARVLRLTPSLMDEPLGALRRALLKARARGQAPAVLEPQAAESLESLLSGEGLDLESCSTLLEAWLRSDDEHGPSGAVLIDDLADIDRDSLEVVRVTLDNSPFRLIVRVDPELPLPDLLQDVPEGNAVTLGPLSPSDAAAVATAWTGNELEPKAAQRWAKRGGNLPLAIAEALAEAIEAGELIWKTGLVKPRLRSAGRGKGRKAEHWIRRRARFLDGSHRAVLFAVAVLGGEADSKDLVELVQQASDVRLDYKQTLRDLESRGWLRRPAPELVALPSSSHRDALLGMLAQERLREWHRAAAVVLAGTDRLLASASATAHATLGGDFETAARLARRAVAAAQAVGLTDTAVALDAFNSHQDPTVLTERGLAGSVWPAEIFMASQRIPVDKIPETRFPTGGDVSANLADMEERTTNIGAPRLPGADVLELAQQSPAIRQRESASAPWPGRSLPSNPGVLAPDDQPAPVVVQDSKVVGGAEPPAAEASASTELEELEPEELDPDELDPESIAPEAVELEPDAPPKPPAPKAAPPLPPRRPLRLEPSQKPEPPRAALPKAEKKLSDLQLDPLDLELEEPLPEPSAPEPSQPPPRPPPGAQQDVFADPIEAEPELEAPPLAAVLPDEAMPAPAEPDAHGLEQLDELSTDEKPLTLEPMGSAAAEPDPAPKLEIDLDGAPGGDRFSSRPPADEGRRGSARPLQPDATETVKALRSGQLDVVRERVRELREGGASAAADRLEALVLVARGEPSEALAFLRPSEATDNGAGSCRLLLARAVALSRAGRPRDALLDALEGLARARERGDDRGEEACARLLTSLSQQAGDQTAAKIWAEVASRVSA